MTMSSLQQRVLEFEASTSTTSNRNDSSNHNHRSFEKCFSSGLDLTEFSGSGGGGGVPATVHSASADLAIQKAKDAARRNREDMAEADLEHRVADVVHAAKTSCAPPGDNATAPGDIVVPRALHPNNILGNGRDDNFIQFQNIAAGNGGFLSSLVCTHRKEEQLETISHKSRQLKNQKKVVNNSSRSASVGSGGGGISSRRQMAKSSKPVNSSGKVGVAKKNRKSKY
ncbi:hypothetical protein ACHAXH_007216 [Discostella pseudostelligera]|jgi:hypothetical protein